MLVGGVTLSASIFPPLLAVHAVLDLNPKRKLRQDQLSSKGYFLKKEITKVTTNQPMNNWITNSIKSFMASPNYSMVFPNCLRCFYL